METHICKYCGAETNQPDNECYKNNKNMKTANQDKWISINELPSDRMLPVLIFNGKSPVYCQCVLQATWFLESKKFKNETNTIITYADITHWMPLPNPPSSTNTGGLAGN
jgi:hypothetical protein